MDKIPDFANIKKCKCIGWKRGSAENEWRKRMHRLNISV